MPVLYIEMDGTGVPVVRSESEGRSGKIGIIALRCCRLSRSFEDYWAERSTAA